MIGDWDLRGLADGDAPSAPGEAFLRSGVPDPVKRDHCAWGGLPQMGDDKIRHVADSLGAWVCLVSQVLLAHRCRTVLEERRRSVVRVLGSLLAVAVATTSLWLARRLSRPRVSRPIYSAILATIVGLTLLILAYIWVFDVGSCNDLNNFACVINTNQGVLTLAALAVTAIAVWTSLLTNEASRRAARESAAVRAANALMAAVEEAIHNLEHVALACGKGGELQGRPQLSVRSAEQLLQSDIRASINPELLTNVDRLLRNNDRFRDLLSDSGLDTDGHAGKDWSFVWEHSVAGFVAQSFHLLVGALSEYPEWTHHAVHRPGFKDIDELADMVRDGSGFLYEHRASDVEETDAARLRAERAPLICWANDRNFEGVRTLGLYRIFGDLAAIH